MACGMEIQAIRHLFGDPDQTAVERAIADMRTGRPVMIRDGEHAVLALAAELVDEFIGDMMRMLAGTMPALVLSEPRLRELGVIGSEGARRFRLPAIDRNLLNRLARGADARIDTTGETATPAEDAALELARLGHLLPAAVVVTITEDLPAVILNAICVDAGAIFAYRRRALRDIRIASRAAVELADAADAECVVFRGGEGMRDQIAIVIGAPLPSDTVLTRIHTASLTGDLLGGLHEDGAARMRAAIAKMAREGGGVLLYLDCEGRGSGIAGGDRAHRPDAGDGGQDDCSAATGAEHRHCELAGAMLRQLGYPRIRLMTGSTEEIRALRAAGIEVMTDMRVVSREPDGYPALPEVPAPRMDTPAGGFFSRYNGA